MAKQTSGNIEDINKIQGVACTHGWIMGVQEAAALWEQYSFSRDASWLTLPKDDGELWDIVTDFMVCERVRNEAEIKN